MTDATLSELNMQDTEELLRELDHDITDAELPELAKDYGLELEKAAERFVEHYNGDNSFIADLKRKIVLYGRLTIAQRRAALNVWRHELLGIKPGTPIRKRSQECYTCGEVFPDMGALMDHKQAKHSRTTFKHHDDCTDHRHEIGTPCPMPAKPEESVLETNDNRLGLDLSMLPNGYYAIPDITGAQTWIFLKVSRQRQTKWCDRRYVWGKVQTGGEMIEAGTMEVRFFHGDSKELVGYQKPGKFYEGKFQVELEAVSKAPEPWALLFAKEIGRCAMCGKTLTDDISRSDGYGPECVSKVNDHWHNPEYWQTRYVNRNEEGHPYCPKHDTYHPFDYRCKVK